MPSSDVLIIGAGVNGLACAAKLAGTGRRVTLLDANPTPGGGMGTTEFAPGFHAPALAHLVSGLDPRVSDGMDLARHGLSYHPPLSTSVLSPDAPALSVLNGKTTGPDAAAFAALHRKLTDFARVLAPFRAMTPPRLAGQAGQEWAKLARLGIGLRALGRADFREFLRMILINIADVATDELTDPRLQALLSFDATLGSWLGPRSPNSLILLLNRLSMGSAPLLPKGGVAAVAQAMTKAVEAAGVTIRSNAQVTQILIEADRAAGVALADGTNLHADLVISAINPRTTFQTLVGPRHLDGGFFAQTRHIRSRGGAAKLHLALRTAPGFNADLRSRLVIAPSVDAVERAFNPVKYGDVPDHPVMEILIPSAFEPGQAPEGQHTLSAIVQFAPHAPKIGLEAARKQMLENTLTVLETHAPGLRAQILHAELLMPQDIEFRFGMVGGNWHHGELAVEQMLFLRPLRQAAQYATPLPGLWLAGAGSHPGGGINGAAGWNAAERIIKERA